MKTKPITYLNNYLNIIDAVNNRKPRSLPLYEHIISPFIMEKILGLSFSELIYGDDTDRREFFRQYCRFFKDMTYDTVSYEIGIIEILPDHGAINGGRPGPIQTREDFNRYPWAELTALYWKKAAPCFESLRDTLPPGLKVVGGVGNGVFEISEDLVGLQYLAYLRVDDPDLFDDIYKKIGELMVGIWSGLLAEFSDIFAVCRFGDDLGFKTNTLVSPAVIRRYILPQYNRVLSLIKAAKKPFLWHSCGNIFSIMEDMIALGIDAKHSNEDIIAPFDKWISLYNDRIGLFGGIDVDLLCRKDPNDIKEEVYEKGSRFRNICKGYALGSGNSIPDYVPVEGYLAMIEAAQEIRISEEKG